MMERLNKSIMAIGVLTLLVSLTCKDTDISENANIKNKNLSSNHTFQPKSESPNEDFVLIVLGQLSTTKNFYVNGPLAEVCIQTLKNEGNFKVTGKLSVGSLRGEGEEEYEEIEEGVRCEAKILPPSVTNFIKNQRVIWFGPGWVEEYDENESLVKRIEGKFYTDPSSANWLYRNDGSWGIKDDIPSKLEGYSLVFETDFRNPAKNLDVYDGGIYVKGNMKDSGNLVVRDKPDEFSVVVLENGFFTSDIDITGKVFIGGDMRLVGEEQEFQGEYRYKIKGDLFVQEDFTCNVNFTLNNLELAQKVADTIVVREIERGEILKQKIFTS